MTPETARPEARAHAPSRALADEEELIAGLWQEVPYPRLPADAPPELEQYLQIVDNPHRVYAIHRASRRRDFQLLVEMYIHQLRTGCKSNDCTTATCFTCRKRLAGKAPIRRYNTTSARTLAVYLASCDNSQNGLCPNLRRSKDPPASLYTLTFSATHTPPAQSDSTPNKRPTKQTATASRASKPAAAGPSSPTHHKRRPAMTAPSVQVNEKPVSKDYRSFAASAFSTVAFKMLEWLTPVGVDTISSRISELELAGSSQDATSAPLDIAVPAEEHAAPSLENKEAADAPGESPFGEHSPKTPPVLHDHASPKVQYFDSMQTHKEATESRRNSRAALRASANAKSDRRRSLEASSPPVRSEEAKPLTKSPTLNGPHPERMHWNPKSNTTVISRGVPDIPTRPAFFENVPTPIVPLAQKDSTGSDISTQAEQAEDEEESFEESHREPRVSRSNKDQTPAAPAQPETEAPEPLIDYPPPQTLSRLNVELVDFICDVFQEDATSEVPWPGHRKDADTSSEPHNQHSNLARRHELPSPGSHRQWKTFNEQVLFSVLSDPRSLVQSFTKDGKLYDSHTLWYCMRRLTRAAPSLVFHSLWMAAESLFTPPQSLQTLRSPSKKVFEKSGRSLSNHEAGCMMSICLHALVAAAPTVVDARTLYEMSRIRANGLVLATSGVTAKQPSSLCLDYDDVFSNDLALRLARRLFCAVSARQIFAEMADGNDSIKDTARDLDVLQPLLDQLDLLSTDSVRIREFSQAEALLHETRVPTLLLDWARAVLLDAWDGHAEFTSDSAFGGALSLIATMHENRNILLLGDIQFRVDYFSDRLDSIEMPVAWLDFTPTKRKRHILEHPYLFGPETLVSFFRSINFSRMSRMFEESSSLKTRMSAIVDPGSLITNPHHKRVLQDLLRTASAKYLVLEIGRENVLRDAFDQLWRREERELLRPLKVHLGEEGGEEGFDSGGVQQEFFRMAISECLDPKYGAFTVDDRTRMVWFSPGSIVELWKYELIGMLVSLAVYNGLTLPITFPKALYRKLLGQPVTELHHIADGWPELGSGLTTLLEWDEKDGLIEDIFARTYEFSVSTLGTNVTQEMTAQDSAWPQGLPSLVKQREQEEAPLVTNDNRDEYVSDYIRYLTDVSVRPQFQAFERGFRSCLEPKSLSLLSPNILQSVVEGVQEIDISELRRYTRYVGWDASHRTVRDFWSIVRRFDDRMKHKLLEFVTASDRVPVGGMRNLQFVVQKNGEELGDGGHLPTAYTCYGTLLLPEYQDKDVLRERLGMALENAQGFGFA